MRKATFTIREYVRALRTHTDTVVEGYDMKGWEGIMGVHKGRRGRWVLTHTLTGRAVSFHRTCEQALEMGNAFNLAIFDAPAAVREEWLNAQKNLKRFVIDYLRPTYARIKRQQEGK